MYSGGMTPAPDFNRKGYPSKGRMIGPAWQIMWDVLQDGQWHTAVELCEQTRNHVSDLTSKGLLANARRHKILEVRYAAGAARKYSSYRVTPALRLTRPDQLV